MRGVAYPATAGGQQAAEVLRSGAGVWLAQRPLPETLRNGESLDPPGPWTLF